MFEIACEEAAKFTRPLVMSVLLQDGRVNTGLGTSVIVNSEGWAVTAGHMFKDLPAFHDGKARCVEHDTKIAAVMSQGLDINQTRNKIKKLKPDPNWVRDWSYWWGEDGVTDIGVNIIPQADLAVVRLQGIDTSKIEAYPKFKRPGPGIKPGAALVKVGYPFSSVESKWVNDDHFEFGRAEVALFPIEGIHTRILDGGTHADGYPIHFVETSSPGLKGQSGGPTLDRDGVVWAIQSMTQHFPLGFTPKIKEGNREFEEHQFLNAGVGIGTATLEGAFNSLGVTAEWVD